MAGYSATPLGKKLGIKEDHRVLFVNAPPSFGDDVGQLPARAFVASPRSPGPLDVIVLFVRSERELIAQFEKQRTKLASNGGLWIAWPKKSSGVATDLVFEYVQSCGLASGLVDNKVCAIDEIWSGLRFVIRVKDR